MGKVLIKCIQTPMQKYFYDRSLDSVVMVNDEEYQILKTVEKTKLVPDGVLRRFVKSGLLRILRQKTYICWQNIIWAI